MNNYKKMTIEQLNRLCQNSMVDHLGICFIEIGIGFVRASMPVDARTVQHMGRLHGGAIMALAETAGGGGSMMLVENDKYAVLGVDINGSHVATTDENLVYAQATILHQGKGTHVWEIKITDANDKLLSVCRLTNRIIALKK